MNCSSKCHPCNSCLAESHLHADVHVLSVPPPYGGSCHDPDVGTELWLSNQLPFKAPLKKKREYEGRSPTTLGERPSLRGPRRSHMTSLAVGLQPAPAGCATHCMLQDKNVQKNSGAKGTKQRCPIKECCKPGLWNTQWNISPHCAVWTVNLSWPTTLSVWFLRKEAKSAAVRVLRCSI